MAGTMSLTNLLLLNFSVVSGLMVATWLVSLPIKNVSIVDIGWGLGFVVIAWTTFVTTSAEGPSRWLLPVMTTLWGVRLSGHLAVRNLGKGEDKRYAEMRSRRGPRFAFTSLVIVFGLQGVVMWLVALPLQIGIHGAESNWEWAHGLGLLLWSTGFFFEAVGDAQLARFLSDPASAGRVLNRGLWRYTRHPNYFGDCLVWWGLWLTSVAHGLGLWTVVSPLVKTFCLVRFSGVRLLERSLVQTRSGYEDYVRETNAFFPWFPRTSTVADHSTKAD